MTGEQTRLDYGCQIYSSACKSKLQELDVVHNMGLRICSGAFRTSPVESIYVDTHQLPLDLRREELGLRYVVRVQSSPENPSNKLIGQTLSINYKVNSKPFQVRLKEQLGNQDLLNQKIQPVTFSNHPPWLAPPVVCCSTSISKKNSPPEQVRARFLEHDRQHAEDFKIYTDGSKSDEGVGCAIVTREQSGLARLADAASSFTAELTAIVHALKQISNTRAKNFVIYTDSKSSIDAICKFDNFHPLVRKAQEWLYLISSRFKSVCFCWVPAHVGIRGNELADIEAKSAIASTTIDLPSIPHLDLYRSIKSYIWQKWQGRWSSPLLTNNKKYKSIRPNVFLWPSVFHPHRRTEVILCRLRIGHTYATHKFLLQGSIAPECAHCDCQLSVEHILVQCPFYETKRRRYGLAGKPISAILGEGVDIPNLIGYLKDIKLYYEF